MWMSKITKSVIIIKSAKVSVYTAVKELMTVYKNSWESHEKVIFCDHCWIVSHGNFNKIPRENTKNQHSNSGQFERFKRVIGRKILKNLRKISIP